MSQQWGAGGGQYGGPYANQPAGGSGWNQPSGYGRPSGGFGPQWQTGPSRSAPTPPSKNPLRRVLGVLILLALVAVAGLVITNLVSGKSDVAYQNDNYQVPPPDTNPPPLPEPQTYEEAQQLITANALYKQTAPYPVRCTAQPINLDTSSDSQTKAHFEEVMACLMRVWNPPVTGAKYTLVRPTVTIYGSSITTKCGTSKINAFYCSADQQVYYSNRLAEGVPAVKKTKWGPDIVMAHEFGHAIQARTNILISAHALGQNSGDDATDLEYSRRLETQADCFSGMYIRAVQTSQGIKQSDVPAIEATYVAIGDDTLTGKPDIVGNHGHGATRQYWAEVGLGTSDVGKCNTFSAPASQVR